MQSTPLTNPTDPPLTAITPYWSPTATITPSSSGTMKRTPIPPPLPTTTPITHTVVKGETMLGIAIRYGISLDDLQGANPDADPRFLSVGKSLIIPLGEGGLVVLPTPTPFAVKLGAPLCYATLDGGVWCFTLVSNGGSHDLENISAQVVLSAQDGGPVAEGVAITPLNIIPAGSAQPLVVFFPRVSEAHTPYAELLTAQTVASEDARYLKAEVLIEDVEIGERGLKALIQGYVSLERKSPPAKLIWLAVVAYGGEGNVVGVRRWEAIYLGEATPSSQDATPGVEVTATPSGQVTWLPEPLKAETILPFEVAVYSLGPPIEYVDVLVEARH